jgi:hypothetical protein
VVLPLPDGPATIKIILPGYLAVADVPRDRRRPGAWGGRYQPPWRGQRVLPLRGSPARGSAFPRLAPSRGLRGSFTLLPCAQCHHHDPGPHDGDGREPRGWDRAGTGAAAVRADRAVPAGTGWATDAAWGVWLAGDGAAFASFGAACTGRAGVARAEATATEVGCVTGGGLSGGGWVALAGWLIRMPATAPAMATVTAADRNVTDFLKLISSMRAYSASRMADGLAAHRTAPTLPRRCRRDTRRLCEPGLLSSNEPGIALDNTRQGADMHTLNRNCLAAPLPLSSAYATRVPRTACECYCLLLSMRHL